MPKVKIRVKEEIIYDQEIEISEEKYNELKKYNNEDVQNYEPAYLSIEEIIDRHDILDTGCEWLGFEITKL